MPGFFNPEDYIDVQERIHKFWLENPEGRIFTELISPPGDFERVAVRASVYLHRDHPYPAATGMANEWKGGGMAQAAAWLETCETSAIGRAFANMGYAVKNSNRPSKQEMEKVQRHVGEQANPPAPERAQFRPVGEQRPTPMNQGEEQWTNRNPPSDKQIGMMKKLIDEKQLGDEQVTELALQSSNGYAKSFHQMSKADSSKFIDALMNGTTPSAPPSSGYANSSRQEANQNRGNMQDAATTNQMGLIHKLWVERGGSEEPGSKHTYVREKFGIEWEDMTKQDATDFIGQLKQPDWTPFS